MNLQRVKCNTDFAISLSQNATNIIDTLSSADCGKEYATGLSDFQGSVLCLLGLFCPDCVAGSFAMGLKDTLTGIANESYQRQLNNKDIIYNELTALKEELEQHGQKLRFAMQVGLEQELAKPAAPEIVPVLETHAERLDRLLCVRFPWP